MNSHQELFGGNIPQDVTGKQGENAIFIVYGLKQSEICFCSPQDTLANLLCVNSVVNLSYYVFYTFSGIIQALCLCRQANMDFDTS